MLKRLDTFVNAVFQLIVGALKPLGLSVPILQAVVYGCSFLVFLLALHDASVRGLAHSGMFVLACFASAALLLAANTFKVLVVLPSEDLEIYAKEKCDRRFDLLHQGNNASFRILGCFYSLTFICLGLLIGDFGLLAFSQAYNLLICGSYLETCS